MHFFSRNILGCDAKKHVCVYSNGVLALSSHSTKFSTNYKMRQTKGDTNIQLWVSGIPKENITAEQNDITGTLAFDLIEFTKGNYDLEAYPTEDIPVITYYSKKTGGNFFSGFFSGF